MKYIVFVLLLICSVAFASKIFRDGRLREASEVPVLNPKLVNYINNKKTTWKARNHKMWKDWSMERVKRLMGAHMYTLTDEPREVHPKNVLVNVPAEFNSITNWPKCTTIGTILNQAECGSCWAFGAVESIEDRFCIFSNASIIEFLSEEDLVACDNEQGGCEGGDPYSAQQWVVQNGLVSANCSKYTVPTCAPQEQPCMKFVPTPQCVKSCSNGKNWESDKRYLERAYAVSSDPNQIAAEIFERGPVEAAFSVYEDFLHYKSGVYQHESGSYVGGHAIKIIGYGTESGTPYWLVANSWTTYWGDKGFFKILKGQNECGIESGVVAGIPKL